jgi:hypothetical protein
MRDLDDDSPMSVVPIILILVGGLVLAALLSAVFIGTKTITKRLSRRRWRATDDTEATGIGELFGDQGLITRGRGGDLYPRDANR